jgi:hypothetical protein
MSFKVERVLSIIGTVICLAAVIYVGWILSPYEPIWPLPGLYLVELVAVCSLGTWETWRLGKSPVTWPGLFVWLGIGILYAFVVMGVFSVGLLFLPVAILFIIVGLNSARKAGYSLLSRCALGVTVAIAQSSMMLIIVRRMV